MPALLLRLLLQCAGYVEMNPGLVSTPTPTNCLRLMQWNASRIIGKITELLTFLHSRNVYIAAIQEIKLNNKTMPLKTPGLAVVRLDLHKNKGGGLLMLIIDTIPFVYNTAVVPQSADPHLEQQGISITMPTRQQLHIYIPPSSSYSAGHKASVAHHLSNNEMRLLFGILMRITPRTQTRTQTKTNEASNYRIFSCIMHSRV